MENVLWSNTLLHMEVLLQKICNIIRRINDRKPVEEIKHSGRQPLKITENLKYKFESESFAYIVPSGLP